MDKTNDKYSHMELSDNTTRTLFTLTLNNSEHQSKISLAQQLGD